MALEGEVINMTGQEEITDVSIFALTVGETDFKFEIVTLDIIGSAGVLILDAVNFVVALEWKQVRSYASGRLHSSRRCKIAVIQ